MCKTLLLKYGIADLDVEWTVNHILSVVDIWDIAYFMKSFWCMEWDKGVQKAISIQNLGFLTIFTSHPYNFEQCNLGKDKQLLESRIKKIMGWH